MKNRNFVIVTIFLIVLVSCLLCILYKNDFFSKKISVENEKRESVVISDKRKVSVEYPKYNDSVGCNFDVKGVVPNEWLHEGSFLVKVRIGESVVYQTMVVTEVDQSDSTVSKFSAVVQCGAGCVGQGEVVLVEQDGGVNAQEFAIPVTFTSTCSVGEL